MASHLTPRQLVRRGEFYRQLGQLSTAGMTVVSALEQLQRRPPANAYLAPITGLLSELKRGTTFAEALQSQERSFPELDRALLCAGEQSGRLENSFRILADYYEERAGLVRQMLWGLAYPTLLLHVAVLLAPFPQLFLTWNFVAYGRQVLGVLLPIYAVVGGLVLLSRGSAQGGLRVALEQCAGVIPVLGGARRALALARLTTALESLLAAGVNIIEAWEQAAVASGSPSLCRAVSRWKPELAAGRTPAELISESRAFPDVFANLYQAGEVSGSLDDTIRRLHVYYRDEASRSYRLLSRVLPWLAYLLIMGAVAWQIVRFYLGYFQQIGNVMQGL